MLTITLTQEQLKMLFVCVDTQLRTSGLESLAMVVDVHNMLQKAQKVEEGPKADPIPEPEVAPATGSMS